MTPLAWAALGILTGLSALGCIIGFKKFVYFLSVGYGLSVVLIGAGIIVLSATGYFLPTGDIFTYILASILILYGCRLSGFLIFREAKSASYRKVAEKVAGSTEKKMPIFVKATIWIMVTILYIMQTSPVFFRVANGIYGDQTSMIFEIVGASIMVIGLLLETISDLTKSAAKKLNPHRFCDRGVYKYVRCPNYLGEILFWTGVLVSSINALVTWYQWVIAILGYILIVYVMLSGAKRLEGRQDKNYGEDPEYQAYIAKTPLISRLIPIKSMKKWNWIK